MYASAAVFIATVLVTSSAGLCFAPFALAVDDAVGGGVAQTKNLKEESAAVKEQPKYQGPLKIDYPSHYPFALVSIEFPVDADQTLAGEIGQFKAFKKYEKATLTAMLDEQILKSTYMASLLFNKLKETLPENSVIMTPTKLHFVDGKLVSVPVNDNVPAVLSVQMFSEVNLGRVANPLKNLGSPDTFAERSRVHMTISVPGNAGNGERRLIAGQQVVDAQSGKCGLTIENFYNVICNGEELKSLKLPKDKTKGASDFIAIQADFKYPPNAVHFEATSDRKTLAPAAGKQLEYYKELIVSLLNREDLKRLQPLLLSEFVSDKAPDVAAELVGKKSKNEIADYDQKVSYLSEMATIIRPEISSASAQVAQAVTDKNLGRSMRVSMNNEMEYEREAIAEIRERRMAAALSIASTAGSFAAGMSGTNMALRGVLGVVGGTSTGVAIKLGKMQRDLRNTFMLSYKVSQSAQLSSLDKVDNNVVEVTADSLDDFRQKSMDRYYNAFGGRPDSAKVTVKGQVVEAK